jgi:CheY-like chemotaxis protein
VRLEFSLLVIDDHPDTVDGAIGQLSDYLEGKGFTLKKKIADDLSEQALRELARSSGKDYNLVMVDYNLGRDDLNGAIAAAKIRRELQFTDMVFYSSQPSVDLLSELANRHVAGVFVANRDTLGDALTGLAETVIGKAVDLSHMRGIAMAEVADMDVDIEHVLEKVFSSKDDHFVKKAKDTLSKFTKSIEQYRDEVIALVNKGDILELVTDPRYFTSVHKYRALVRVADCLAEKPDVALGVLKSYMADVIENRNTLAHAKEEQSDDGTLSLRAIKKGKPSIPIDEAWMIGFRGKLRTQRTALAAVCDALIAHTSNVSNSQKSQKSKS